MPLHSRRSCSVRSAFASAASSRRALKSQDAEAAVVDTQPVDERGRKRSFGISGERMTAHNDEFCFSVITRPDYLFLWCKRPAYPSGGDSFLIDAVKLTQLLAFDPATAELAEFCWSTDVDHSEPNFPQNTFAPIARTVPSGRNQVRYHRTSRRSPVNRRKRSGALVKRWSEAVIHVRAEQRADVPCRSRRDDLHRQLPGAARPRWVYRPRPRAVLDLGMVERRRRGAQQALDIVQPDIAALAM